MLPRALAVGELETSAVYSPLDKSGVHEDMGENLPLVEELVLVEEQVHEMQVTQTGGGGFGAKGPRARSGARCGGQRRCGLSRPKERYP